MLGGLPYHSHISSFLHDVFTRQVVVTLELPDTRVAICVSLPSFAFHSSLRKNPFLFALRRWGRFSASPAERSEEKRMFSQAISTHVTSSLSE